MIRCYKFGLLHPTSGVDEDAVAILKAKNQFWNQLVESSRHFREKYQQIILASSQELQDLDAQRQALEAQRQTYLDERSQLRQKNRNKSSDAPLNEKIKAVTDQLKQFYARIKELKKSAKETSKADIICLQKEEYEARKKLRQESQLWWPHYEAVLDHFEVALKRARKEGAELRFKSFDGSGTFCVRRSGGVLLEELMSGQLKSMKILPNGIDYSHLSEKSQRHKARHSLTIAYDSYKVEKKIHYKVIEWPIILSRPIPDNAVIKLIQVSRKRVGERFEWSCSITLDLPDETPKAMVDHASTAGCGIDLGFRLVKEGLRVATLVDTRGKAEHIVLSTQWLNAMDYVEILQGDLSNRDTEYWHQIYQCLQKTNLDALEDEVKDRIKDRVNHLLKIGKDKLPLRSMRSIKFFLEKNDCSQSQELMSVLDLLKRWLSSRFKLARQIANMRQRLLLQRKHLYQNVAIDIARNYSLVRMEDLDLKSLTQVKLKTGEDNELHKQAKKNRTRAALYELISSIKHACTKNNTLLEAMPAAYSSSTCSACGAANIGVTEEIHVTCEKCGILHDQDENAAKNFLLGDDFYQRNH